mgnify:CR=1 FL=1
MTLRKLKYENLEKYIPNVEFKGKYGIPVIKPSDFCGTDFVDFNHAKSEKNKADKAVHFFLDDFHFERIWKDPLKYYERLQPFPCVLSPDFSMFTEFPLAMQIYNHYRKHWLAAYWQNHGINVIPTIGWVDEDSYEWCFDGEPCGSTVAISSVGTQKSKESKRLFIRGYNEMIERLNPSKIIFYGNVPEECRGNIVRIKCFSEKWKEAATDGHQRF